LLATLAAVRFLSCEPLLSHIDLRGVWNFCPEHDFSSGFCTQRHHEGVRWIDWVICGDESGPGRRLCSVDWVRDLWDQCVGAGVPFFLKQLHINGRKASMPELDGRVWDQMPERVLGNSVITEADILPDVSKSGMQKILA
jgi:protein gp37